MYDIVISIGKNCGTSGFISRYYDRKQTFMFDWANTNLGMIHEIIKNGKNGKLDKLHENIDYPHYHKIHDYQRIKRMIERFFNVLNSNLNVLFLYIDDNFNNIDIPLLNLDNLLSEFSVIYRITSIQYKEATDNYRILEKKETSRIKKYTIVSPFVNSSFDHNYWGFIANDIIDSKLFITKHIIQPINNDGFKITKDNSRKEHVENIVRRVIDVTFNRAEQGTYRYSKHPLVRQLFISIANYNYKKELELYELVQEDFLNYIYVCESNNKNIQLGFPKKNSSKNVTEYPIITKHLILGLEKAKKYNISFYDILSYNYKPEYLEKIVYEKINSFSFNKSILQSLIYYHAKNNVTNVINTNELLNKVMIPIIPIGANCEPSHHLNCIQIRQIAYPFDWNVTPLTTVIELFANNFSDILNYDNFIFSYKTLSVIEKDDKIIINREVVTTFDKKLKIFYPHDFTDNSDLIKKEIKEKYLRRVERMKDVLNTSEEVVLYISNSPMTPKVRQHYTNVLNEIPDSLINPQKYIPKLAEIMKIKYPHLLCHIIYGMD